MSDIKHDVREAAADTKEAWRKADGESLGDKVANVGDRVRNAAEDAGDEIHEGSDKLSRDVAYERGRADEMNRSR
jgi:hypothetical protein